MMVVVVVWFLFCSAATCCCSYFVPLPTLRCNVPGYRGQDGAYHCDPLPPGQLMVVGMTLFLGAKNLGPAMLGDQLQVPRRRPSAESGCNHRPWCCNVLYQSSIIINTGPLL